MNPEEESSMQRVRRHLPADARVYLVSDLHLGDGTRSDTFQGKDEPLIALIEQVNKEGAHLVIAGDAIDFSQAWFVGRVFKAHGPLFRALSELAEDGRVTYIWGNHDADISFFRDVVRFDVCSSLQIGEEVIVRHGYEYDPYIGPQMDHGDVATRLHHLFERIFNTWVRTPIEQHYTLAVRIAMWLFHKFSLAGLALGWIGFKSLAARIHAYTRYWTQAQVGDPQCIFEGVRQALQSGPYTWIVTGHSHLPGKVELHPGRFYVNTGSWTFGSAQYALWQDGDITVQDWRSGKVYTDQHYLSLVDRRHQHVDYLVWWRENYLGWLRYRVAEEGRIPFIPNPTAPSKPCV
jgi:UDP-2,3-diacylglucosamine hydrolase